MAFQLHIFTWLHMCSTTMTKPDISWSPLALFNQRYVYLLQAWQSPARTRDLLIKLSPKFISSHEELVITCDKCRSVTTVNFNVMQGWQSTTSSSQIRWKRSKSKLTRTWDWQGASLFWGRTNIDMGEHILCPVKWMFTFVSMWLRAFSLHSVQSLLFSALIW